MLDVAHLSPTFALGSFDRVLLQSWTSHLKSGDLQLAFDRALLLSKRFQPKKIVSIAMISTRVGFPDDATRKRAAELITQMGTISGGAVTVIDGTGFVASAARAIMAGIQMLGRSAFPQRVFSSLDEACEWLVPLIDDKSVTREDVIAAMKGLRERQGAPVS